MEGKGKVSTNRIICARVQLKELRVQIYLVNEYLCGIVSELSAWAKHSWGAEGGEVQTSLEGFLRGNQPTYVTNSMIFFLVN